MAVANAKGIQSEWIPKIATGFCSGVSRTGGMCGALSGAIMGVGLRSGRNKPGGSVDGAYDRIKDIVKYFEAEFGSISCLELTGCHLGTDEGQARFRATNQIEKCLDYVAAAVRMVLD